jgi:hypothetical protein
MGFYTFFFFFSNKFQDRVPGTKKSYQIGAICLVTIQEYALPNMTTCSSDFMERPNKEFKLLQTD